MGRGPSDTSPPSPDHPLSALSQRSLVEPGPTVTLPLEVVGPSEKRGKDVESTVHHLCSEVKRFFVFYF